MKCYGRSALSDLFGDSLIYRKLEPVDQRLPRLDTVRRDLSLPTAVLPRKKSSQYGQIIAHQLKAARALDLPGTELERVLMVGDTRMNDGTAFINICRHGAWRGAAFIGTQGEAPASVEMEEEQHTLIYNANRWQAVRDFASLLERRDFAVDEHTAVLLDIDKTLIGARGRNDHVIDRARLEAANITANSLLGEDFDPVAFENIYNRLNRPEFHTFTTDNQDYLVYLCLILCSGLFEMEALIMQIQSGQMADFEVFVSTVDQRSKTLSPDLKNAHLRFQDCLQAGDPTPFKTFRAFEFQHTIDRMGQLDDDTPVEKLLAEEIVLTREVQEVVLAWKENGALVFGLSDKPDEATMPSEELAARGYLPVHKVQTHIVGA